jgi:membrane protein DedA with SNARE-associated domain
MTTDQAYAPAARSPRTTSRLLLGAALLLTVIGAPYAAPTAVQALGEASYAAPIIAGFSTYAPGSKSASFGLQASSVIGASIAALLAFWGGRMCVGQVLGALARRRKHARAPSPPPRWLKALMFLLPVPERKPGAPPLLARSGVLTSFLLHALPPPGPAFVRIGIDALLGASAMPAWKYAVGAIAGLCAHVAVARLAGEHISSAALPSGWLLVPALLAPLLAAPIVRLALLGWRALFTRAER